MIISESAQQWIDGAAQFPRLAQAETATLIAQAQAGNMAARDAVFQANMLLVVRPAYAIAARCEHLKLEDLLQAGASGLLRAIQTYDPARSMFSTYATWWIRQAVGREAVKYEHEIAPPTRHAWTMAAHMVDLDNPDDDGLTLADKIAAPAPDPVPMGAAPAAIAALLERVIPQARDRIIVQRLAIDGATLQQIADEMALTRSRIHQIVALALPALRRPDVRAALLSLRGGCPAADALAMLPAPARAALAPLPTTTAPRPARGRRDRASAPPTQARLFDDAA